MPLSTEFSRTLGLKAPIVCAAMQWVSVPPLAAAAATAGALGLLTALSQPSPDALREAIKETRRLMNGRPGKFVCIQQMQQQTLDTNAPGRQHHPSPLD